MTRKIVVALLIGLCALPVFAGGAKEASSGSGNAALAKTVNDPRLFQPGKLTVATGEPVYPPWMLNDKPESGEGFENGLVYALAAELGFKKENVVWVRKTFDEGIAPGKKAYDFNIQQYSVTEERRKFVDFSTVYYQPEKAVVALPAKGINKARTLADLKAYRWGATIGTTDLTYIETSIGVKDIAVFNDQAAVFQAMLGGQIDATVISLPTALYATAVQVPDAKVVAILPADPNDEGFAMIFEKDSQLVPWINEGLQAIIKKGVVAELTKKYLIGDESIPVISK
jgi:polar amino acid transport system substrate-binding protein